MKKIYLLIVLLVFVFGAVVDAGGLITNVDHRDITELNGSWRIIIDPYENGFYDYRYKEYSWGFFKDAKQNKPYDLIEYNFDTSDTLQVPGDWNSQKDELFFYEGTVWYRKKFDYDLAEGKRLFVYFGAVNYEAVVYLNGSKLGVHTGGYTPFEFEITDKVKAEGNSLVLKVDNTRQHNAIPTVMSDWWNYGGITRRVLLIEEEQTFIRDYKIQLAKGSQKTVDGWVQLDGGMLEQEVVVDIPEAGVSKVVKTDGSGYAKVSFDAKLELWEPGNPKLYKVVVKCGTDTIEDKIGFRSLAVKGADILLNGKSVFLRGICIHEEGPMHKGRAYSREDAEVLLGWAKELNCNFVRLAHYPHNEFMTRVADEMGILVWSEIPLYWTIQWENKEVYNNAVKMLDEMVARDKNKASIILWSVSNETPVSGPRTEFLGKLAEYTKGLDPTRLVTAAMEKHTRGNNVEIADPLGAYLDVLGCNEYVGWYEGDNFGKQWVTPYDKPLIMSELGGGALQGLHGGERERWTEEFQDRIYKGQIPMLKNISFLRGISPWILRDFLSPRRPLPYIQDYYNRKGLISERGQKKQAFYTLQEFYGEKKAVGSGQ